MLGLSPNSYQDSQVDRSKLRSAASFATGAQFESFAVEYPAQTAVIRYTGDGPSAPSDSGSQCCSSAGSLLRV